MEENKVGQKKINGVKPKDIGVQTKPNDVLCQFHVYHAINKVYMFREHINQPRKYVGYVLAKDLNDAWKKAQNEFNPDYARLGVRSVAVGDLLQNSEGFFMIKNVGFEFVCSLAEFGE